MILNRMTGHGLVALFVFAGAPTPDAAAADLMIDVSATHLPAGVLTGRDMDARPADLDGDGDLDLVVAVEFGRNIVLRAEGGQFVHVANALPNVVHDSEDIAVADFDGDGDLDVVFVSEDDQINEYYLNDGTGLFTSVSGRIPVTGVSNAVITEDLNGDTHPDLVIGNDGQNVVLINNGAGFFVDETAIRLPAATRVTQDLEMADVDGDGDRDLVVGNEDGNALLINDGAGVFTDETADRLPLFGAEETREADFGDVDDDGDVDLFFANVDFAGGNNRQNRLLLNDGSGCFTDVTATHVPADNFHTVDIDFIDIDRDDDLDIVLANAFGGDFRVYLNDGQGFFTDDTVAVLPASAVGSGIDIEAADFSGDGRVDLFMTNYQSADILLFAPCAGDIDGDGVVAFSDILAILAAWGPCPEECPADENGDGLVGFGDILVVLANWGACA